MALVDTNVLVYAANREAEFHSRCARLLAELRARSTPWYLSWPICFEFLRVSTHPGILSKPWSTPSAWSYLKILLDSPSAGLLVPTMRHEAVLTDTISEIPHLRGNILHDLHTAVLMREHGIREIYTRDIDFSRFPFLRVIDPLA